MRHGIRGYQLLPSMDATQCKINCATRINMSKLNVTKSCRLHSDAEKAILRHNFIDEPICDFANASCEEHLKYVRDNRIASNTKQSLSNRKEK